MHKIMICLAVSFICLNLGCASQTPSNTIVAKYTETPVKIDGKLDDPAWKNAKVYTMNLSKDNLQKGKTLQEDGEVRTAWDDNYFYLGIKFQDSDIIATGDKDQMHHYKFGDLCELFLKPADEENYVELYVTPANKKTSFYIPNQKDGWPSRLDDFLCNLQVAAHIGKGTLNDRTDRDQWWSAEIAMPIEDLEKIGEKVNTKAKWRILVARYNYSKFFGEDEIEYSMTPMLSKTNYHTIYEYARLSLEE